MQPNTSRLTRNALGRARWDDTIGNYWSRADGWALSFQHRRMAINPNRIGVRVESDWRGRRLERRLTLEASIDQNNDLGNFI